MPNNKELLKKLDFFPKENESEIFYKKFPSFGDYIIEADFLKNEFDFGSKIKSDSGTTQNFSQEENWVVLECVNRLLEKGYKPEDITLEKIYPTGHGTSGRLDILVKKNKRAYLMIECKTWGQEFDKAFKKLQKDGGQLFTYFQQDRDAEYLMLYASNFDGKNINCKNEIIKIEEHYREAGNVKDFYDRWNKLAKQNGIFDDWVNAYEFQSKALIKDNLVEIKEEDSHFIFNQFLATLRKHAVSDKPNAFNKIFNLFLCKIFDEKKKKDDEVDFQWFYTSHGKDGKLPPDDHLTFQKRLANLYKQGMLEFLRKQIVDISDQEFEQKFGHMQAKDKEALLVVLTNMRLKKNNEFAIKEVFDEATFLDNAVVVKDVVELLQKYQVRYPRKQQYLSDFFERLLTTGLKQESGQFFTPVPIARFIIKSLPIKEILQNKLKTGNSQDLLPAIIDYAAGSGHFLTESMEEIQKIIEKTKEDNYFDSVASQIKGWRINPFDWAGKYIYGIEKDYRLVKVAKVGCYFYGDGLAQVIHGDGLDNFYKSNEYSGLLLKKTNEPAKEKNNQVFDFVISNPPYSVSSFKGNIKNAISSYGEGYRSFELFDYLTDQSSEIECLFIERTKQLLKDGGFAGIILPSSILSNAGIYTKAREILLKYFEIVAITELGSGTFMATGTNTVILFLRRRTNYEWENVQSSVDNFFQNHKDVTVNGIENIFSKYVKQVWDKVNFEDYVSFCRNNPNEKIKNHDIYKEYDKKIKAKNEEEQQKIILEIEKEKLIYFILAYPQKIVVVKSGKKKEEKSFLGYEFSNRRGYEGIHPIQRSKSIDECTKMYDLVNQENTEKANSYVYKAFLGELDLEINESMKKYVFQTNLVDMMAFDRVDFEKTISLSLKKTSKIESKWEAVKLSDVCELDYGTRIVRKNEEGKIYPVYGGGDETFKADSYNRENVYVLSRFGMSPECVRFVKEKFFLNDSGFTVKPFNNQILNQNYLNIFLFSIQELIYSCGRGVAQKNIDIDQFKSIKIPLPPKDIQEKIVSEIEKIDDKENQIFNKVQELENEIKRVLASSPKSANIKIGDILTLEYGSALTEGDRIAGEYPVMGSNGIVGYHNNFTVKGPTIIVGRKGSAGKITWINKDNFPIDTTFYVNKTSDEADYKFIYYVLRDINLEKLTLGAGVPGLNRNDVYKQTYKLPPFSEQQKIVAQIIKIEDQMAKHNQELQEIKNQKAEILKKYL